jgi:hypothetical protein
MLGFWFVASSKLSRSSSAIFLVKVFFAEELFDGQPLCALQLGAVKSFQGLQDHQFKEIWYLFRYHPLV